jgi:hypothetical protein
LSLELNLYIDEIVDVDECEVEIGHKISTVISYLSDAGEKWEYAETGYQLIVFKKACD